MTFSEIGYPVLILSGLGILFGAGLAYASSVFEVKKNPLAEEIEKVLPRANCGVCGYGGCSAFAQEVAEGRAEVGGCPAGGNKVAKMIAKILGKDFSTKERLAAIVFCKGGRKEAVERFEYVGIQECTAAMLVSRGNKACIYGCLGYGSCREVCPFNAITMNKNGLPVVNEKLCTACGKCVDTCPKQIIRLVPVSKNVHNLCSSLQRGKDVKNVCSVGCITCGLCVKACPVEAIMIKNNLAVIDYEKCTNCGLCAAACPTKSIVDFKPQPKTSIKPQA